MSSGIAEHMIYGETHNIACEDCGTHEGVYYRCFMSGGGAHLCKDCMIKHETGECIPSLVCCLGIPIILGMGVGALVYLDLPTWVVMVGGAIAFLVSLPISWKISRRISESYWRK